MTRIAPGTGPVAPPPSRSSIALTVAALALPMIGLALLVARPALDLQWEHQPTHFWLVAAVGAINAALAWAVGAAAGIASGCWHLGHLTVRPASSSLAANAAPQAH